MTITMVLLITPSLRGVECASAIQDAVGQPSEAVKTFQEGAALLRSRSYSAVIIDECLLEADRDQGNLVLGLIEAAVTIYVNCAICGTQRVVDKVKAALEQRQREEAAARRSAVSELRAELTESITGIILNCELALNMPDLKEDVRTKFSAVNNLAQQMSEKLQPSCSA